MNSKQHKKRRTAVLNENTATAVRGNADDAPAAKKEADDKRAAFHASSVKNRKKDYDAFWSEKHEADAATAAK